MGNKAKETQDDLLKKTLIIQDWDKIRLQQKDAPDTLFVVNNKQRDLTLRPSFGSSEAKIEIEALITFEEINLIEDEAPITQTLKYDENKGFVLDFSSSSSKAIQEDDGPLKITFQKIHGPNKK